MHAPICLFTYNRLYETQQTIEALKLNDLAGESELIVFSDGPKNETAVTKVTEVRKYLKTINGFKTVRIQESPVNKGLANSIIEGVTQIIEKYGKVIVLEDDLISTPHFLNFMNRALDFYKDEKQIQSINGFSLSLRNKEKKIYFQNRPFPWGWATWADRWNKDIFDKSQIIKRIDSNKSILKQFRKACGDDISGMLMDSIKNKNDSWYVRWTFEHFLQKKYSVFPVLSFISNIGHNADGTHCKGINSYYSVMHCEYCTDFNFIPFIEPSEKETKEFLHYFSIIHKLIVRVKLLPSAQGRTAVFEELKTRLFKQ